MTRAERADEVFQKEVAIKVIRRGLDLKGGTHLVMRVNVGDAVRLESDQAMEAFRKANELDPSFNGLHLKMGQTYGAQKMYAEAVAEYQKEMMRWDRDLAETMRQAFASGGYTSVNRVWLEGF